MAKVKKDRKKKMPPQQDMVNTIRGIWLSLDSHLDHAIPGKEPGHKCPYFGNRKFHADCCVEYAEMILALARNL